MASLNPQLEKLSQGLDAVDSTQMFFVSGFVKSGTTWLEKILDTHPDVICKGEAHFFSLLEPQLRHALNSYNVEFPEQGNWSRLKKELPDQFDKSIHLLSDEDNRFLIAESVRLMMVKWMGEQKVKAVGDKTPDNIELYALISELFPEAKFIYIIRDIKDIIVSNWHFNLNLNKELFLSTNANLDDYGKTLSNSWHKQVSQALALNSELGTKMTVLQYESLSANPDVEVAKLFEFLGVNSDKAMLDRTISKNNFEMLSKGRSRGEENRRSFYRKGIVGDWRNHLQPETVEWIHDRHGPLLQRLGYLQTA